MLLREIEKCDVRCANCHRRKTLAEVNSWRHRVFFANSWTLNRRSGCGLAAHRGENGPVLIRDATDDDWPAIWPFLHEIVAAGETYTYPLDLTEPDARALWMLPPPGRTTVAVDDDGTVLGSAKMNPNHAGNGSHIASASFMVDPAHSGKGVGRALGEDMIAWATDAGLPAHPVQRRGRDQHRRRQALEVPRLRGGRHPAGRASTIRSTATSGCTSCIDGSSRPSDPVQRLQAGRK